MTENHPTSNTPPSDSPPTGRWPRTLSRGGMIALLLSAFFLWLSGFAYASFGEESPWGFAILMLVARTFGVATFVCGVALLVFESWTAGMLLIIGSIVPPGLAVTFFGVL
jgi:hypothetical protein